MLDTEQDNSQELPSLLPIHASEGGFIWLFLRQPIRIISPRPCLENIRKSRKRLGKYANAAKEAVNPCSFLAAVRSITPGWFSRTVFARVPPPLPLHTISSNTFRGSPRHASGGFSDVTLEMLQH